MAVVQTCATRSERLPAGNFTRTPQSTYEPNLHRAGVETGANNDVTTKSGNPIILVLPFSRLLPGGPGHLKPLSPLFLHALPKFHCSTAAVGFSRTRRLQDYFEILKNLTTMIKESQREFYRTIPVTTSCPRLSLHEPHSTGTGPSTPVSQPPFLSWSFCRRWQGARHVAQ